MLNGAVVGDYLHHGCAGQDAGVVRLAARGRVEAGAVEQQRRTTVDVGLRQHGRGEVGAIGVVKIESLSHG